MGFQPFLVAMTAMSDLLQLPQNGGWPPWFHRFADGSAYGTMLSTSRAPGAGEHPRRGVGMVFDQFQQQEAQPFDQPSCCCPHSGIARTMKASNIGTVKAVCPWAGLQIMPFLIRALRNGPAVCTLIPNTSAI